MISRRPEKKEEGEGYHQPINWCVLFPFVRVFLWCVTQQKPPICVPAHSWRATLSEGLLSLHAETKMDGSLVHTSTTFSLQICRRCSVGRRILSQVLACWAVFGRVSLKQWRLERAPPPILARKSCPQRTQVEVIKRRAKRLIREKQLIDRTRPAWW